MAESEKGGRPRAAEDRSPHPVDLHVGSRMVLRRGNLGVTRSELARAVNLTFQQIQKFERGTNRISASRLYDVAQALDVPVGFFFDDMPEGLADKAATAGQQPVQRFVDPMALHETVVMLRAYHSIPDRSLRRSIHDLARALAATRRHELARGDGPPPAADAEENNGGERAS